MRIQLTPPSRFRRAAVVLCNVLAVVVTLELCCRLFREKPLELVVPDEVTGRHLVENLDAVIHNSESDRFIRFRTNSRGFRGDEPMVPKPAGLQRVVVLGDSFIEAAQVAERETFCERLEVELNQSDTARRTWEVLNLGIAGAAPSGEYVRYLEVVRELEPDLVIVAFGMATDVTDLHPILSRSPILRSDFNDEGQLEPLPLSKTSAKAAEWLGEHCHLYGWQRERTNAVIKQLRAELRLFDLRDRIYLNPPPEEIDYAWRLFEAIVAKFRTDVEADGRRFLLVAIPSGDEIYREAFRDVERAARENGITADLEQELPARRLREICERQEVPHLLLQDAFRDATPSRSLKVKAELLHFRGKGHLNPAGHALAARETALRVLSDDQPERPSPKSDSPQLAIWPTIRP